LKFLYLLFARNILEVSAKAKEQEEQLHENEERVCERIVLGGRIRRKK